MHVIEFLGRKPLQFVIGARLGNVPNVFLNVDFGVAGQTLRVSGKAADMPDRTEAFYLSASLIPRRNPTPTYDSSTWGAIDILSFVQPTLGSLFKQPREVRFYRDFDDENRGLKRIGCLESAAAIEFGGSSAERGRVVLFATADYPCSVEILTDPSRCDELLAGLVRFVPGEAR
jgi:hypothetical protein